MSLTSVIPIICISYVSKITDEKSVIKQVKSITNISANKTVIFVIISIGITIILDATSPITKYKITYSLRSVKQNYTRASAALKRNTMYYKDTASLALL